MCSCIDQKLPHPGMLFIWYFLYLKSKIDYRANSEQETEERTGSYWKLPAQLGSVNFVIRN